MPQAIARGIKYTYETCAFGTVHVKIAMIDVQSAVQLISADPKLTNKAREVLCQAGLSCKLLHDPRDCEHAPACRWLQPLPAEMQLRLTLDDAISTLEKTRHAFKSRDLADLRRRLQQLLETL